MTKLTMLGAFEKANAEQDQIIKLMDSANVYADLWNCFYEFGECVSEARDNGNSDEEMLALLSLIDAPETAAMDYMYPNFYNNEKDTKQLRTLWDAAVGLYNEAKTVNVELNFADIINVDPGDVEGVCYWSSSSLGC